MSCSDSPHKIKKLTGDPTSTNLISPDRPNTSRSWMRAIIKLTVVVAVRDSFLHHKSDPERRYFMVFMAH
jgi:hypothetical protein